jgi:hypothetical protein
MQTLLADNTMVVVLLPPDIDMGRIDGRSPDTPYPESDPARMARFRQIVRDVAAGFDRVRVVDLAGWLGSRPDERRIRPDGVHFTDATSVTVARWLGPELVTAFREQTGHTTTQVRH